MSARAARGARRNVVKLAPTFSSIPSPAHARPHASRTAGNPRGAEHPQREGQLSTPPPPDGAALQRSLLESSSRLATPMRNPAPADEFHGSEGSGRVTPATPRGAVMTDQMTQPTTKTLDTAGAVLTYDVRRGPTIAPVLLLIGSPMGASGFGTLASHFTDRTVVTYDPRGA